MAILPLVIAPDDRLLTRADEIESVDDEVRQMLDDMVETTRDKNGIGLAAVQVGVMRRAFIAEIPESYVVDEYDEHDKYKDYQARGGPFFVVNPVLVESSEDDKVEMREGCLSIPRQGGEVIRPRRIVIEGLDYNGNKQVIKARGWLSRCFQHEIDHLNGKLFIHYFSKLKYEMAIKKAEKVKRAYFSQ